MSCRNVTVNRIDEKWTASTWWRRILRTDKNVHTSILKKEKFVTRFLLATNLLYEEVIIMEDILTIACRAIVSAAVSALVEAIEES